METVVCNASSEKIQDEISVANLEGDGVHFTSTKPLVSMPKDENPEKFSFEGKVNQSKIKEINQMLDKNESGQTTDTLSSKSLSPTLIEHALKVVKNIFSPDKNRSKPPSVLTTVSQHCASGSPRNSLLVGNKSEIFPEPEPVEFSNFGIPSDVNLKGDPLSSDQTALSSNTPSQDSHNNTNDSFLTTVSLIEESFQSAVTHLDNADGINGEIEKSDIFSNSRNLDVMDPNNDTLSGSEYGLENTILKNGSFVSVESLLNNISDNCDKNILEGSLKEYINDIDEECQSVNEEKIHENNAKIMVVSDSCNTLDVDENGEKNSLVLKSSEQTLGNSNLNVSFIGEDEENINITRAMEMKELVLNKALDERLNDSGMTLNVVNDVTVIENDLSNLKFRNCLLPKVENSKNNILEKELDKNTDTTISTTTIILSETDSDCCNALNLTKDNENSPPHFCENSSPKTLKEFFSNKQTKTTNINITQTLDGEDRIEKKGSKSSNSTPINMLKCNKNKLNKSLDSVTRKNIYNSPKAKKSFRQQLSEDFSLSVSKKNYPTNSLNYFPTTELKETLKNVDISLKMNERKAKIDYSIADENNSSTTSFIQDTNSLSSQQSYTILNISDTNLKRPVINSFEDFKEDMAKTPHSSPSYTITNSLNIKKTYSDLSNNCSNLTNEETHSVLAKRSTPELNANNFTTLFFSSENRPSSLRSMSPSANDLIPSDRNSPVLTSELEFSPVVPDESEVFPFVHSVEKQATMSTSSPRRTPPQKTVNLNQEKTSHLLNKTLNDSVKTPEPSNLNQTFDIKPASQESNKGNDTFDLKTGSQMFTKLNETFNLPQEPQMSETINSKSEAGAVDDICKTLNMQSGSHATNKMNETFDKKPDALNQTFDIKLDSPLDVKLNKTFEKKKGNDDSFSKLSRELDGRSKNVEEMKFAQEKSLGQSKPFPAVVTEPNCARSDFLETLVENRECLNSSFISTASSNTSLLCNNNLTILLNQESSRSVSNQDMTSAEVKPDEFLSAENEEWSDTYSRPPSAEISIQNENVPSDSKINGLIRNDKVQCDSDLEQLIQKQFTNTDIEKICSVVDDFSINKPTVQVLNSCLSSLDEATIDNEQNESSQKFFNPLSPHSFDFLNSIGGKPTGRDWSRESLYVKFDPLVQAPSANSLIDFTKEADDLRGNFESPAANNTAVEHLLSISPQKKSDEIVPPLTPFSHRNKNVNGDETERLKELQNEIYFLKNLYAERERTNKNKLDNYETQVAKLTGQSCILENNLKESNEREKSLVRKLQEQNQNITQMKLVMEEYIKVITKLTTELEKSKSENSKKLEALTAEKDSYVTHLQNTEAAFTDVHAKYEKSKKTIVNLKTNEAMFRQTLSEQMQKMDEYKEKTRDAQERACKEMQRLQDELSRTKASHSQETARLRAQLRKTELKLEAVQESLDQKIKENQQLTAICDELIEGKK